MKERDAFPFRTQSGGLIDQSNAGGAASVQCGRKVVDGKAHVMDSRTALSHEPADG